MTAHAVVGYAAASPTQLNTQKMAGNKTVATDESVSAFIAAVDDERQRDEAQTLIDLCEELTGSPAKMWGSAIVGSGSYHYTYESGREGDMPLIGFSPRKGKFAIYIMAGFDEYDEILSRLGKHKTGKSCLYITRLDHVDLAVLRELMVASVAWVREKWPST